MLDSPDTHPRPKSREEEILSDLRSGGYAIRYDRDGAVHRVLEPHGLNRGPATVVGIIIIRGYRIVFAEFSRRLYPYWGRSDVDPLYLEARDRFAEDVHEGRRK